MTPLHLLSWDWYGSLTTYWLMPNSERNTIDTISSCVRDSPKRNAHGKRRQGVSSSAKSRRDDENNPGAKPNCAAKEKQRSVADDNRNAK